MNVLLLSDFSKVAINATHYAMDLLQEEQVNFHLLNIFDPEINALNDIPRSTPAILDERVQKLRKHSKNPKHQFFTHYSEEKLVNAARLYVEKMKIDLIVMGAVGHLFRHSTILGKHTYEIISKIKCNILAVPEDIKFKPIEKLLFPIDLSASFERHNFKFLQNSPYFNSTQLKIWEISDETEVTVETEAIKEIFSEIGKIQIDLLQMTYSEIFDRTLLEEVQTTFDLLILLGKNLQICDRLLHHKHGEYSKMPNRLPILVLHD